ncbi:MAG TPA: hypothetical protein EYH30_09220 [Anaerolineales bacterium]|nr:hypothetical protein [Anaerolineae bacterium]HIQ02290.1 hypothetical protein [Anaerolineales bacterium]
MKSKWILRGIGLALALLLLAGLAWGLRGRGLRTALVSRARALTGTARAVLDRSSATGGGDFTNVIFLHHSTGRNLIEQGGVRELFGAAGYDFWDHGYNDQGLTRPDGTPAGYSYNVPNDNTDPDGLAHIFSQRLYPRPLNTFSGLMQHEVIIFKSCFPVSNITADAQLEQYKAYYLQMRDVMDRHPDHLFIIMTPPPLNPAATDAEAAARARAFAEWLGSDEFLEGHPNVYTFDFFDLLAESDPVAPDHNMLREAYRDGEDSHPNQRANETVGPLFVEFVIGAVEDYRASGVSGSE